MLRTCVHAVGKTCFADDKWMPWSKRTTVRSQCEIQKCQMLCSCQLALPPHSAYFAARINTALTEQIIRTNFEGQIHHMLKKCMRCFKRGKKSLFFGKTNHLNLIAHPRHLQSKIIEYIYCALKDDYICVFAASFATNRGGERGKLARLRIETPMQAAECGEMNANEYDMSLAGDATMRHLPAASMPPPHYYTTPNASFPAR